MDASTSTHDDIYVTVSGDPAAEPVLLLHGWPESSTTWEGVTRAAGRAARLIAIDLPGVGRSRARSTDGSTDAVADAVAGVLEQLEVTGATVVGHDFGGMVTYPLLRRHPELVRRAVIMDVVVPGVDPWQQVLANPYIWHFGLHAVPGLPERLVTGREADYFAYFYEAISADAGRIGADHRAAFVAAYDTPEALTAGFDWYRAFPADAASNASTAGPCDIPVLCLRGAVEGGSVDDYVEGLRAAGVTDVSGVTVDDAGHFAQEEQPEAVWAAIANFMATH